LSSAVLPVICNKFTHILRVTLPAFPFPPALNALLQPFSGIAAARHGLCRVPSGTEFHPDTRPSVEISTAQQTAASTVFEKTGAFSSQSQGIMGLLQHRAAASSATSNSSGSLR